MVGPLQVQAHPPRRRETPRGRCQPWDPAGPGRSRAGEGAHDPGEGRNRSTTFRPQAEELRARRIEKAAGRRRSGSRGARSRSHRSSTPMCSRRGPGKCASALLVRRRKRDCRTPGTTRDAQYGRLQGCVSFSYNSDGVGDQRSTAPPRAQRRIGARERAGPRRASDSPLRAWLLRHADEQTQRSPVPA